MDDKFKTDSDGIKQSVREYYGKELQGNKDLKTTHVAVPERSAMR